MDIDKILDFYSCVHRKYAIMLTGSQFFNGYGNDFDFFVDARQHERTPDTFRPYLKAMGFTKETGEPTYKDKYTAEVWRNPVMKVDIQFCTEYIKKIQVQTVLKANKFQFYGSSETSAYKEMNYKLWNIFMDLA